MFKRLLLEEHATLCLTIAFVTASSIFFAFLWRALRMSHAQVDRFARLPFAPESKAPAVKPAADSRSSPG